MALSKITNLSILDDTILNADIKSSAAIALSKLATDPSNATNLASGTVPTARLGSGTASSSTVLYGDQTYKAEPGGGKILQVVSANGVTSTSASITPATWTATVCTASITPSATSSTILVWWRGALHCYDTGAGDAGMGTKISRAISGGATTDEQGLSNCSRMSSGDVHSDHYLATAGSTDFVVTMNGGGLDSPSTTSALTYTVHISSYSVANSLTFGGTYGGTWMMTLQEVDGS